MSVLHQLLFTFTFYLSVFFMHFSHLPIPTSGNHQSLLCTCEPLYMLGTVLDKENTVMNRIGKGTAPMKLTSWISTIQQKFRSWWTCNMTGLHWGDFLYRRVVTNLMWLLST